MFAGVLQLYCVSLWPKVSAKCPPCKCVFTLINITNIKHVETQPKQLKSLLPHKGLYLSGHSWHGRAAGGRCRRGPPSSFPGPCPGAGTPHRTAGTRLEYSTRLHTTPTLPHAYTQQRGSSYLYVYTHVCLCDCVHACVYLHVWQVAPVYPVPLQLQVNMSHVCEQWPPCSHWVGTHLEACTCCTQAHTHTDHGWLSIQLRINLSINLDNSPWFFMCCMSCHLLLASSFEVTCFSYPYSSQYKLHNRYLNTGAQNVQNTEPQV